MRVHRVLFAAALVAIVAVVAHGQAGLTGKWQGKTDLGGQVTMDAKADGEVLTGIFAIDKQSGKIASGKISKNAFTFYVSFAGVATAFSGQLSGDEIRVTRTSPDGPSAPIMLTRVK